MKCKNKILTIWKFIWVWTNSFRDYYICIYILRVLLKWCGIYWSVCVCLHLNHAKTTKPIEIGYCMSSVLFRYVIQFQEWHNYTCYPESLLTACDCITLLLLGLYNNNKNFYYVYFSTFVFISVTSQKMMMVWYHQKQLLTKKLKIDWVFNYKLLLVTIYD